MSNVFSRSWGITKMTLKVINEDKELFLFPLLSGLFSILFIIAMIIPSILTIFIENTGIDTFGIFQYIIIFLIYLGLAFIATFFNVCVVYTAGFRFSGKNATFMQSIKFAFSKLHLIFAWALVSATVGLILRLLENIAERFGVIGQRVMGFITMILGMAWSITTIFVIPAMVYKNIGPFKAIQKSIDVLKKTWGESLIRYFGLGLIEFLFIMLGVFISVFLSVLLMIAGQIIPLIVLLALAFIYFIIIIMFFRIANTVFNTALYIYAESGIVPQNFNEEVMKNALKPKKGKFF
ncbi:MAG: DUF6159 family protein [Nanobdellota archaeon]